MAAYDDMVTVLQTWVRAISGQSCFVQNEMGPPPNVPYCTIHVSLLNPLPHDTKTRTDTTETIRGLYLIDVAVTAWGDGAEALAVKLRNSIFADNRYTDLWTVLGKSAIGDIKDLASEYNGKMRPRAEFVLSAYTALETTFVNDYFESNQITINTDKGDDFATFTIGVNDPPESQEPCNFQLPGGV